MTICFFLSEAYWAQLKSLRSNLPSILIVLKALALNYPDRYQGWVQIDDKDAVVVHDINAGVLPPSRGLQDERSPPGGVDRVAAGKWCSAGSRSIIDVK